jgi:AGZA family xanthine/uracil permease-like MFS transporter
MSVTERLFGLAAAGTTVRTEALAGVTTFLTMAYIIFVQPAVLSGHMFGAPTGMDFGALATATCLSAALASAVMGLYARYPIALAPGMGENFFFVLCVIPAAAQAGLPDPWRVALGVVFVSAVLFYVLYFLGIREVLFDALSPSMKSGIAVGIGIFIAFIGLQQAGVVLRDPGTAVKLNPCFASPDLLVFFFGLLMAAGLHTRRVRGAILWSILGAAALAAAMRWLLGRAPDLAAHPRVAGSALMTKFAPAGGVLAMPPSPAPTFMQMDVAGALTGVMIPFVLIFLFMDTFDTIGTLVGVGEQAGLIRENRLPRARQAMLADTLGTVFGSLLGAGTTTSYIESAAGVEVGGRTGLTSLTVAALFLLALFFSPVVAMVGSYPPITAPALVMVGAMMAQNARKVQWDDLSESVPAFLVMIGIPLTYSIGDGLALGFLAYPIVKLVGGRRRDVNWLMWAMAAVLAAYFVLVRSRV